MAEMKAGTILLVDDDESIHLLVKTKLEKDGYEVVSAYTTGEGMVILCRLRPDLILLDFNFPGHDGDVYLKRFKSSGLDIPVIVITGTDEPDAEERMLQRGADAFLRKPIDFDKLKQTIRKILNS